MKSLKNTLLLSCKRVTELIEKRTLFGDLSFLQNIQLKMHVSMCKTCKHYMYQSETIDQALEHHFEKFEEDKSHELSDEAKEEIMSLIKEDK